MDPSRSREDALFASGAKFVIGVDEAGRGCLAGEVSVGACLMFPDASEWPAGVRDSKALSEKTRVRLLPLVYQWSPTVVGFASATEIVQSGIVAALSAAGSRALATLVPVLADRGLHPQDGVVLLDGTHDWLTGVHGFRAVTQAKADRDCVSVAAASIAAKTERDLRMIALHDQFPEYAWSSNKGYGAAAHYAGISSVGYVPGVHRVSWLPEGSFPRIS